MLHQNSTTQRAASLKLFWEICQLPLGILHLDILYCASSALGHDSIRGGGAEISGNSSRRRIYASGSAGQSGRTLQKFTRQAIKKMKNGEKPIGVSRSDTCVVQLETHKRRASERASERARRYYKLTLT
jgi:hypothetical protein